MPLARPYTVVLVAVCTLWAAATWSWSSSLQPRSPDHHRPWKNVGRRRFASILECYLRRNLIVNGGVLDKVVFLARTMDRHDLEWVHASANGNPHFEVIDMPADADFFDLWQRANETDAIYVKIDDDIVFIDDQALPRLMQALWSHPNALAVASNLINSPIAQWYHQRVAAVLPYVPLLVGARSVRPPPPSTLTHLLERPQLNRTVVIADIDYPKLEPEDTLGWHLHGAGQQAMRMSPLSGAGPAAFGLAWSSWAAAAQQHYSFLHHAEQGDLSPYWFGGANGLWFMQNQHYNINLMAIRSEDIDVTAMRATGVDDETAITERLTDAWNRPFVVHTEAVAAHFAFSPQRLLLEGTDLLERYRQLAPCYTHPHGSPDR